MGFIAQRCAQGHKWFRDKSVSDTVEIPDIHLYMYIRAQKQLNALNLLFDTPCSLPVICLPALISVFILSSFQQGPKSSVSFTFRRLYLNIPLRKILHILSQSHPFFLPFLPRSPSLSPLILTISPQLKYAMYPNTPDHLTNCIFMA